MTQRGTLLGGRYELDEVIGRGGMAEVWRARDTRLQRDVAVKRLRVDLASDPTFQARFRREAQASAGLNHPNIVAVYDTGEEKDGTSDVMVPYMVMELIEGVTLREVLRGGRKIVPEKALEFTAGVLDALAYSHRSGIIHRDIKPANVMFTPPGAIKVMDFGIARAVADTSATMTQTAAVIGTAQYLSPEQARGEKVDNRSDLYSVGCLLYELLVSEPPFKGDSPVSVAYQHVREKPVPPSERDPEVTADMDAIVMKALAKDPKDRYQDAGEFREDIMRVLNNVKPVAAAAPPPGADAPTQVIASDPITATARRAAPPAGVAATGGATASHTVDGLPAYGDEPEKKKGRAVWIVLGLLGALLVGALLYMLFLLLGPGDGRQEPSASPSPSVTVSMVPVPHVEGLEQVAAENRLRDAGLEPEVKEIKGTQDNDGTVESSDPAGGTEVAAGSTVTLNVYTLTSIQIPNVAGMPEDAARRLLEEAGFDPDKIQVEDAEPSKMKKGTVTGTEPDGSASPNAEITLLVATGENLVPDLDGTTEAEARKAAQDAGFQLGEVKEEENAEKTAGQVFKQDPKPGKKLKLGEKIKVTVAKAKEEEKENPGNDGGSGSGNNPGSGGGNDGNKPGGQKPPQTDTGGDTGTRPDDGGDGDTGTDGGTDGGTDTGGDTDTSEEPDPGTGTETPQEDPTATPPAEDPQEPAPTTTAEAPPAPPAEPTAEETP